MVPLFAKTVATMTTSWRVKSLRDLHFRIAFAATIVNPLVSTKGLTLLELDRELNCVKISYVGVIKNYIVDNCKQSKKSVNFLERLRKRSTI